MGTRYGQLAFGPAAVRRQAEIGSVVAYGAKLGAPDEGPDALEPQVQAMVRESWHFFLGSTTPAGWPYIQHRGGPKGFVHVLDERTLGFADVAGNRQFVTTGNVESDDRVALFFIDYARKRRVKIYGRAKVVELHEDPELLASLAIVGDEVVGKPERSFLVAVEAVDINCSRHIEPLWPRESVDRMKDLYQRDVREAQAEAEQLRRRVAELEA
ncbi:MAG: pyridoxamine 5'-phosphate oxidase family protein, partial [Segniliparus sp.]|uniref:pyridoxamine 5'-phosphate oxidase family protein n=1 Tax=Segniliparus sp. TaxID=2804064 RepID=UPI003F2CC8AC